MTKTDDEIADEIACCGTLEKRRAMVLAAIIEARDKALDEASEIAHSILLVDSQPVMASHVSTAILAIKEPKP